MGRHKAEYIPTRELRRSYTGLREAYERLLRDHRRLEAAHTELLGEVPRRPSTEVEVWRPSRQTVWGRAREAMDIETALTLIRESGLLTSPGLE